MHFLTLEIGARMFGIHNPGIGVYRPNDNKLIDWLQVKGRMRSNKSMLDRKDLKGMIRALKQGDIIWYAPKEGDKDAAARAIIVVGRIPDNVTLFQCADHSFEIFTVEHAFIRPHPTFDLK